MATYYNDVENGFHRNMRETNWQKLFPHWWDPNYLLKAIGDEVERIKAMYVFALLNSTIKPPVMLWKTDIDNAQYAEIFTLKELPENIELDAPLYETWGQISFQPHSNDVYNLQIMITEHDGIEVNDIIEIDDILKFDITNQKCRINSKNITFTKIGNGIPEFLTSKNTEPYDPKNPLHNEILRVTFKSKTNKVVDAEVGVRLDHAVFITEQNIEVTGLELIPIDRIDLYAYYDFPQNSKVSGWRKVYTKEYLKKTNVIYDMITTHFYTQKFYVEVFFKGLDYPYRIGFPCYRDAPENSMYHVNNSLDKWSKYLGLKRRMYKKKIDPQDYPFTFPQFYPYDIEQDFWYYSRLINEYCWNEDAIDYADIKDTNGSSVIRLDCIDPFVQDFIVHARSTAPTYIESTDFNAYKPTTVTQDSSASSSVDNIFVNPSTQSVMTPTKLAAEYKQTPFTNEENLLDEDEEASITLYKKSGVYISNEQYMSKELDIFFDLKDLPEDIHITGFEVSFTARSSDNSSDKYNDDRTRFVLKNKNDIIYEGKINTTDLYEINTKKITYGGPKNNYGLQQTYTLKNEFNKEVKTDVRDILLENGLHFIYSLINDDNGNTPTINIKNVELKVYYEPKKETFNLKTYIKKEKDNNKKIGTLNIEITNTGEKDLNTTIDIFNEDGISLSDDSFVVDLDSGSAQQHIVDIYPQIPIINKKYQILVTCENVQRLNEIVVSQGGQIETNTAINPHFIKYGNDFELEASVSSYRKDIISEGSIRFYINDYYIGDAKVNNNKASLNIKFKDITDKVDAGLFKLEGRYTGSETYQPSRKTSTILISKKSTSLTINSSGFASINHLFLYEATVKDINGNPINEGKISFYIANDDHTHYMGTGEVVNGIVSFNLILDTVTAGDYNLIAKYDGSVNYAHAEEYISLTIIGGETSVGVFNTKGAPGQSIDLVAKVTDINNNNVKTGTVSFYIDDVFIGLCDVFDNGLATLKYTIPNDILVGDVTLLKKNIKALYHDENETYDDSSNEGILEISYVDVTIKTKDIVAYQRESIGFLIKIEESLSGKKVETGHVQLLYKGDVFAEGDVEDDGYVRIIYNPILFSQNDFDRLNKFSFEVSDDDLYYYFDNGSKEKVICVYDGNFTDLAKTDFRVENGDLYIKNETGDMDEQIYIGTDGNIYARTNVDKQILDSVFGNSIQNMYDIVYTSDKIYSKAILKDNKLITKSSNIDIDILSYNIEYGIEYVLKAYVTRYSSPGVTIDDKISTGTVSFYVDGNWLGESTVIDGVADLPFNTINNYTANSHLLQVEYIPESNEDTHTISSNIINVSKINSIVNVEIDKIIPNQSSNIYVKVEIPEENSYGQDITGNVQLYLNDVIQTSYYLTSDEDGECILKYQIPNDIFQNKYKMEIKYLGNNFIKTSSQIIPISTEHNTVTIYTTNKQVAKGNQLSIDIDVLTDTYTSISNGLIDLIDEYGNVIETSSVKNNQSNFVITTDEYDIGKHFFTLKYYNSEIFKTKEDFVFTVDIIEPLNQVYVDITGNDINNGSVEYPVKTIQQALQLVNKNGNIYILDSIDITQEVTLNDVNIYGYNNAKINFYEYDHIIDILLKKITPIDVSDMSASLINLGSKYNLILDIPEIIVLNNNLYYYVNEQYIRLIVGTDNNIYSTQNITLQQKNQNNLLNLYNNIQIKNIEFVSVNNQDITVSNYGNLEMYYCIVPKQLKIYNNNSMKINQNLFYGTLSNYTNSNIDNNWWGINESGDKFLGNNHILLKIKAIGSPVIGEDISIVAYLEGKNGQNYELPPLYVKFTSDTGFLSVNNGYLVNNNLQTLYTDSIKEGRVYCEAGDEKVSLSIFDYDRKTEVIMENLEAPIGYQIPIQAVVQSASDLYYKFDKDNNINKSTQAINNGYVRFYLNDSQIGKASVKDGLAEITLFLSNKYELGETYNIQAKYESDDYYFNSETESSLTVISDKHIVYVSPDGSNNNDGSFTKPYQTIQQALKKENIHTIYLFDGFYKDSHITINKDITIKKYSGTPTFSNIDNNNIIIFNILEKESNAMGISFYNVKLEGLVFKDNQCQSLIYNYGYLEMVNCTLHRNTCVNSLINIEYGYGLQINYSAIVNNTMLYKINDNIIYGKDTTTTPTINSKIINLNYNWWGDNNPPQQETVSAYDLDNWIIMTASSNKNIIYIGSVAYITAKINSYIEDGKVYSIPKKHEIPLRIATFKSDLGSLMPVKDFTYNKQSMSLFNSNDETNVKQIILTISNNINYVSQNYIHIDCNVNDVYGDGIDNGTVSFVIEDNGMLIQENVSVTGGVAHLSIPNKSYEIGEYDVHCTCVIDNQIYNTLGTLIIKKLDIVLKNVSIIGTDKLYNCDFFAEVYDSLDNIIYNNTAFFKINNETIYNTNNNNVFKIQKGYLNAKLSYKPKKTGTYTLTLKIPENDIYDKYEKEFLIKTQEKNTYINFTNNNIQVNTPFDLKIRVYDDNNNLVPNGEVYFKITQQSSEEDISYEETIDVINGTATIKNFNIREKGMYSLVIYYEGVDGYYKPSSYVNNYINVGIFPVILNSLTLQNQLTHKVNDQLSLNFPVTNQNGVAINVGYVSLYLNNVKINDNPLYIKNGLVAFNGNINNLVPGKYNFKIIYTDETNTYAHTELDTFLIIRQLATDLIIDTITSAPDVKATIPYDVESEIGAVKTGTLSAYYNNKKIGFDLVSNKNIILDIPLLSDEETYEIIFKYEDNQPQYYSSIEKKVLLIIQKEEVKIYPTPKWCYPNKPYTLVATIQDREKDPINIGIATLYIDGIEFETVNVTNGVINYNINYKSIDNYNISIVYQENKYYKKTISSYTMKVTSLPINDIQLKNPIKNVFGSVIENELIFIVDNDYAVSDGVVDLSIDDYSLGSFFIYKNKDINITIPKIKAGEYNLTISYHDSDIFDDKVVQIPIEITLKEVNITINDNNPIVASVDDEISIPIVFDDEINGLVRFYIGDNDNFKFIGMEMVTDNDCNYLYKLPLNLEDTDKTIKVEFDGDDQHMPTSSTAPLEIIKQESSFVIDDIEASYMDIIDINIHDINIGKDELIQLFISQDGQEIYLDDLIVNNNYKYHYQLPSTLKPGVYSIIGKFSGTAVYKPLVITSNLIITPTEVHIPFYEGETKAYIGGTLELNTFVEDKNGNAIDDGSVSFVLNNKDLGTFDLSKIYEHLLNHNIIKDANLVIKYIPENNLYIEEEFNIEVKMLKNDIIMTLEDCSGYRGEYITLNLNTDVLTTTIPLDVNVKIDLNGNSINDKISLGMNTYEILIPNKDFEEKYPLIVSSQGNDCYNAFEKAFSIDILNKDIIYVSKEYGDNSNNGEIKTPLYTMERAIDTVADNGKIIILDGTYEENVIIDKNISIESNNMQNTYKGSITINGNISINTLTLEAVNIINNKEFVLTDSLIINGTNDIIIYSNNILEVENCTFKDNNGSNLIYIDNNSSKTTINQSTFTSNNSKNYGGCIYSKKGKNITITNNTFDNNTSSIDGNSIALFSNAIIKNNIFNNINQNNVAEISILSGTVNIDTNIFKTLGYVLKNLNAEIDANYNYWNMNSINNIENKIIGNVNIDQWLLCDYIINPKNTKDNTFIKGHSYDIYPVINKYGNREEPYIMDIDIDLPSCDITFEASKDNELNTNSCKLNDYITFTPTSNDSWVHIILENEEINIEIVED